MALLNLSFGLICLLFNCKIILSNVLEERNTDNKLSSEIIEIGQASFGNINFEKQDSYYNNHNIDDSDIYNGEEPSDLSLYSTSFVNTQTGTQYEKHFLNINELLRYNNNNNKDNNIIGEYTSSSDTLENGNRRNLVILGSDTRIEETGNPPSSNPEENVVCIGMDGCDQDCCCSGFLIDKRWVLTAGHCVYDDGNWFTNVKVWPRRTRNYTPSSISAYQLHAWTPWVNNADDNYDQGWIELQSDAHGGHGSFGWSNGLNTGMQFKHYGYSGDKPDGTMWGTTGGLSQVSTLFLKTSTTDTKPGNSGGPWFRTQNNVVYATHEGGVPNQYNFHVRITQSRFNAICDDLPNSC